MITTKLTISRLEAALRSHSGEHHQGLGSSLPAAVAVLFNITNGEPCVVMIKRSKNMSHHSSEWAFPGGVIEKSDESPMHAALRETNEEIGVDEKDIDVWCGMAPIDVSTGFEIWPYAGRITDHVALTLCEREVDEIANVPVRIFVDESAKRTITIIKNGSTRSVIAYAYEDRIIWGASARIIANTIELVTRAA